jgi:hypothetical protein
MKRPLRYLFALVAGSTVAGLFVLACGARSGLDPIRHFDSGEVGFDAGTDAGDDTSFGFDVFDFDAGVDAYFPVDVIAPVDVHVALDSALACPEGGLPTAYLFDNTGALFTFDPATLATTPLGTPACDADLTSAWTLSVSRENAAYLVFSDTWSIFKVDLTSPSLTCTPTPFVVGQLGLEGDFSIAVSRSAGTEKLFYYGEPGPLPDDGTYPNTPAILAESDLSSFVLTEVAPVVPEPPLSSYPLDMQGDPLGNLFGYSNDGLLIEIDSTTGAAIGQAQTGFPGDGEWAVMSYENQVYLFGGGQVARYDIATQSVTALGSVPVLVVGASAVPCLRGGNIPPPP